MFRIISIIMSIRSIWYNFSLRMSKIAMITFKTFGILYDGWAYRCFILLNSLLGNLLGLLKSILILLIITHHFLIEIISLLYLTITIFLTLIVRIMLKLWFKPTHIFIDVSLLLIVIISARPILPVVVFASTSTSACILLYTITVLLTEPILIYALTPLSL